MKKFHTFLLVISLICTLCLGMQTCFAVEQKAADQQTILSDTQEKTTKTNDVLTKDLDNTKAQKAPLLTTTEEPIPSFGWGNYFQGLGIMLLLLFVFWYILKLMRKYGNGRFLPNQKLLPRDSMYLEGQLPLGQGKSILIVRVLDERLVLGVTEKNINLLSKTGTNHAETFEELMQQVPFKNTPDA